MKLRIRGDSVRIRLSQKEVKAISEGKAVREKTRFLGTESFEYVFMPTKSIASITAEYKNNSLVVSCPEVIAFDWANSDQVALKHDQAIAGEAETKLFILIEKDFQCLKPRENEKEDESELFANPNAHKGHCG